MNQQQVRVNSRWAVASFVLGIVSVLYFAIPSHGGWYGYDPVILLCFLACPPLGLLCGIIALRRIGTNRSTVTGLGWAVAGIIAGAIGTLIIGMGMMSHIARR